MHVTDQAETQERNTVMQAYLRDRRRFHIDGQGIRKHLQHLRILLRVLEKAVSCTNQAEMHLPLPLQAAGGRKQFRIRIEALRQTLHLARKVPLTAPDIVIRGLRSHDDIEQVQAGSERPRTAGIDDTVRPLGKNHFRRQPCRRDLSDTGAFHTLDSGTLQGLVLGTHCNN